MWIKFNRKLWGSFDGIERDGYAIVNTDKMRLIQVEKSAISFDEGQEIAIFTMFSENLDNTLPKHKCDEWNRVIGQLEHATEQDLTQRRRHEKGPGGEPPSPSEPST